MPEEEAPKRGGGIGATLTHKIGPLPLWAYAVIGGGIGFLYLRNRAASSSSSTTAAGPSASGLTAGTISPGGMTSTGGVDSSSTDAQLQTLSQQIGNLSTAGEIRAGFIDLGKQVTALPSVIQPPAPQAPVSSPNAASNSGFPLGFIFKAPAGGPFKLIVPDLYGAAAPGQPGYGTHGAGVNELAAYAKQQDPNTNITPTWLATVNGGNQWFQPGQQITIGSPEHGPFMQ